MRKKLLAMMLATAMGLSLTACGGEGGSGGKECCGLQKASTAAC